MDVNDTKSNVSCKRWLSQSNPDFGCLVILLGFICDEVGFFKEIVLFICHTLGRSL